MPRFASMRKVLSQFSDSWQVAATFLLGSLLTAMVGTLLIYQEDMNLARRLEQESARLADMLGSSIKAATTTLRATSWVLQSQHHATQGEIREFIRRALENTSSVSSIAYYQHVPAAARARVEAELALETRKATPFLTLDAHKHLLPAAPQKDYEIVRYAEPRGAQITGFDAGSTPSLRRDYELARDTGEPIANPILLVVDEKGKPTPNAISIAIALYRQPDPITLEERRSHYFGHLVAATDINGLMFPIHEYAQRMGLDFEVVDIAQPHNPFYSFSGEAGNLNAGVAARTERIELPGRVWEMRVRPNSRMLAAHGRIGSSMAIATGMLFTLVSTLLVYRQLSSRRRMFRAQLQLRGITDSLPVGVFQFQRNPDGRPGFRFLNDAAARLLGIKNTEMLINRDRVFDRLDSTEKARVMRGLSEALERRGNWETEIAVRIDGEARWIYARAIATQSDDRGWVLNGYWQDVTEDKQAARHLAEAVQRAEVSHRNLIEMSDAMPGVVFQSRSRNGVLEKFIFVSKRVDELMGVTQEELTSNPDARWRHVHKDDVLLGQQQIVSAARNRNDLSFTFRVELNGVTRWIHSDAVPTPQDDGSVLWNGYWGDITSQVLAQQALADQVKFQTELVDAIPIAIFFKGADAAYLGCNKTYEASFGVSRYDLIGKTALQTSHHPQDLRGDYHIEDVQLIDSVGQLRREMQFTFADGDIHDVMYTATAFKLDDGRPGGLVGALVDITRRKRFEDAVRLSEERLQLALNAGQIGSWDWHPVTNQAYFSDLWLSMLGYERGEVNDDRSGWKALIHPDDVVLSDLLLKSHLGGEVPEYRAEYRMRHKDGHWIWIRAVGRVIARDEAQQAIRVSGVHQDISTEKTAADALHAAKELAEETTRMKSDFLANMSHEIRTPMNAVIGISHLVLKTELLPRQRDYVQKIQQSALHLLGIINDILDFSKIEAGKLGVEKTEFEMEKLLDNVANLIADKAGAKDLELIFDVANDVPQTLLGDPLRLGQILINYANNAVKFTDAGEIDVVVRVRERTDNDVLLHFAVRDTGIGLNAEQTSRLFQSFQQADTSTTRKYGGTGLGLAIAKRLATLMGGEVGVESVYGRGSTFWFTARLEVSERKPRSLMLRPDIRGKRVLVVDDNDNARAVLHDLLGHMTFEVIEAASGVDAIQEVARAEKARTPYDIVFLDWHMPGLDGVETARKLSKLGFAHTPHLIMVTAHGRDELLREARAAGIEDVLVKPVNASLLFDTAMRALGEERMDEEEEIHSDPSQTQAQLGALASARILLAEDNDLNQEVAAGLLTEAGFIVDIAENGQQALDMVQSTAYDLVLMDMQMPVMDGLIATLEIRKLEKLQGLPIIAMTANAMASDRERCLAVGMHDFVSKPIEPEELWQALLRWIKPAPHMGVAPLPMPAEQDDATPMPTRIAGLDMAAGLRRVLGKKSLYVSMLRKFVAGQAHSLASIRVALNQGDTAAAERLAHTLKGVAGNIGATHLRRLSSELEQAIQQQRPAAEIADCLHVLQAPLGELLERIGAALPSETIIQAAGEFDLTQRDDIAAQLQALLEDDDSKAEKLLAEHAELLKAALGADFRAIEAAIRQFDFESALPLLNAAMRDW